MLTAKHCVTKSGGNKHNMNVLFGDTAIGGGEPNFIENTHLESTTDAALLELEDEVTDPNLVVGYGLRDPEPDVGDDLAIAGWGDAPSPTLQVATMGMEEPQAGGATEGNRWLLTDVGQGIVESGDSGAGVHVDGLVYGVVSTAAPVDAQASAVPTNDIAGWIEQTSGVAPVAPAEEDEEDPMDVDSDEGGGGCMDSPTLPAEDTSPEGTRDIDGHGRGQSGADVGNAIANAIEDVENADENVKALVGRLAQANPACNVMVIQQETYGEPVDISGVKEQSTVVFGTNTFDVWVFDSGTFTNDGDMGWDNWGWSGTWTRSEDQRTVTFEPIG